MIQFDERLASFRQAVRFLVLFFDQMVTCKIVSVQTGSLTGFAATTCGRIYDPFATAPGSDIRKVGGLKTFDTPLSGLLLTRGLEGELRAKAER